MQNAGAQGCGRFVAAILLTGVNLRPAIISVSPLLPVIQGDLGLTAGAAGLLTSLPVLLLALSSPAALLLAAWNIESPRVIAWSLIGLAGGIAIRSQSLSPDYGIGALWVGTVVIGLSIGIANATLPGLVRQMPQPARSVGTAVLSFALCLGGVLAAGVTEPLRTLMEGQWALAFSVWVLPAALCALCWWRLPGAIPVAATQDNASQSQFTVPRFSLSLWCHPLSLSLCANLGMQSLLSHSTAAWLPTILVGRGMGDVSAGAVLSVAMGAQLITSLGGVWLAGRSDTQRVPIIAMYLLALIGFAGLVDGDMGWTWWYAVLLGLGQGGTFSIGLLMIVLRSPNSAITLQLAVMSQLFGYTIASIGPWLLGVLRDYFGSWAFASGFVLIATALGMAAAWHASGHRQFSS